MGRKRKLPITEEIDFAFLLELMPPLHNQPEFAWLPELFSIVGHETLLLLAKFAGGETIRIPTIEELSKSIDALQWYYDTYIKKICTPQHIPLEYRTLVQKIWEVYNAGDDQSDDQSASGDLI